MKKGLILFFIVLSFSLFFISLKTTGAWIGRPFPGYLAFQNGVVGPYYVPGWSGPGAGMTYHEIASADRIGRETFSATDYVLIVLIPAVTGLLFVLLGFWLSFAFPEWGGRFPILFFHVLVGNYLILSPEFQMTYHFAYLHLILFALIPAVMIHFAFEFPEREKRDFKIPYSVTALLLIPYLFLFKNYPRAWIVAEYAVVAAVIGAYLFWIYRLTRILKTPHLEHNRVIARSLLGGQIAAFAVPFVAAIAIFILRLPVPLNLATPLTLLFPLSLFAGVLLGRLRQSRMQLVQTEKRAALGGLLAGLAHEINNPLNFIYANLEPLRDGIGRVPEASLKKELSEIARDMEEGAKRTKAIIDNFRFFSTPERRQRQSLDAHHLLEQSLNLLSHRWQKSPIELVRRYGVIPKISGEPAELGQVFVNILSNAIDALAGKPGRIEIITSQDGLNAVVRIRDSGPGITPKNLSKIFDPFFTTKAQGEGTGLGLSISRETIHAHGGSVDVRSGPDKGTEFIVKLPV